VVVGTTRKETMRSLHVCGKAVATSVLALGLGLAFVPTAAADPTDGADTDSAAPSLGPGTGGMPTAFTPSSGDANPAALDACKQFSAAMNYAATGYEDFAYATAGTGNYVNYGDPQVQDSNVVGRAALKEAAAAALKASSTPGLQPEVSGPMQQWSMDAAKLLVIMAVNSGGDALNGAATDLNKDARAVQMACVAAGTRA
jgi:hypothetical protein